MPQNAEIRLRRDTAANWTSVNPVLALGEMGLETDTRQMKFGDGATAWTGLSYTTAAATIPDPIVPADGTQNITGALTVSGVITGSNLSGTNTGNQTSIVGITGSLAEFNTALTGADFATGGGTVTGTSSGTNTGDQTSIVGITGTKAQFDTAVTDGNILYVGDVTQYTDEMAQDAVGAMVDASLTYVDATPLLQRAALTGDVTAAAGANATTIAANAVSFAKFVAAPSAGVVWATGAANYSHNASGGGTTNFLRADGTWAVPPGGGGFTPPTGTGFVHITAGAMDAAAKLVDTADINDDQVTYAKIQEATALSVLSNATNATANVTALAAGTDNQVLRRSGTALAFGAVNLASANAVTGDLPFSNIAQIATDRLVGRDTAATGDIEALTVGGGIEFTGSGGIQTSAFTGDVTKAAGGTATTIAANAVTTAKILDDNVTLAKIANAAASSKLLGSGDAGIGANYVEITLGTNLSMSGTTLNASGGGSVAWGAITGTLSSQTDLQSALDAKAPIVTPTFTGGAATVSGTGTTTFTITSDTAGTPNSSIFSQLASGALSLTTESTLDFDISSRTRFRDQANADAVLLTVEPAGITGGVPIIAPAATTSITSMRLPHGTAPSAPTNGDLWTTTSGIFVRINGSTVGPLSTGGGSTPTGTGFRHVTSGVEDAAAVAVNLASADVSGDLPFSNIAQIATDRLLGRDTAATGDIEALTVGGGIEFTGSGGIQTSAFTGNVTKTAGGTALTIANGVVSGAMLTANGQVRCITFIIDGGGSAITTGIKGDLEIPFACTITGWTMLADQSGSIVVDIWKDTYANYPPVVGDSITASDKPTISAATKGQDLAPTGWTTAVAAGDTLRFNVDSASTVTRVTLSIRVNIT